MKIYFNHLFIVLIASCVFSCERVPYDTVIRDTNVFDMQSGEIIYEVDIGVREGEIVTIDNIGSLYGRTNIIKGKGKYVIPGMCDSHTHLCHLTLSKYDMESELQSFIQNGVLYVRDVGGPVDVLNNMRNLISSGAIKGPEIFYTGPMLESSPLHFKGNNYFLPEFTVAIDDYADADSLLPLLANKGATMIKTFNHFKPSLYAHVTKLAKEYHLKVVHDPGGSIFQSIPMDVALECGVKSFEHAQSPIQAILKEELALKNQSLSILGEHTDAHDFFFMEVIDLGIDAIDEGKMHDLIKKMKINDAILCPTIVTKEENLNKYYLMEQKHPLTKEQEFQKSYAAKTLELCQYVTRIFSKNGVRILVGHDGTNPNGIFEEMSVLSRAGITNIEILRGASLYAAEWLERDKKYGSVEIGKVADLVLLNENPLDSIPDVANVYLVMQEGVVIE